VFELISYPTRRARRRRWEQAVRACDEMIAYARDDEDGQVRTWAANGLAAKCRALWSLHRWDDVLTTFRELEQLFPPGQEDSPVEALAFARNCRAGALMKLGRFGDAQSDLETVIGRYGHADSPQLKQTVFRARLGRALLRLFRMNGSSD
jgi:hypothetical protein